CFITEKSWSHFRCKRPTTGDRGCQPTCAGAFGNYYEKRQYSSEKYKKCRIYLPREFLSGSRRRLLCRAESCPPNGRHCPLLFTAFGRYVHEEIEHRQLLPTHNGIC